jgi:hypothetical protein
MLESAWLFIGLIATITTGVAVGTTDDGVAIVAGIAGFMSWGFWTYGTLNVEIVTETGTVVSQSLPAVTYFGVMMALIPGFIALTGPTEIINRARKPSTEEL